MAQSNGLDVRVRGFLDRETESGDGVLLSDLHEAYARDAKGRGEKAAAAGHFSQALGRLGIEKADAKGDRRGKVVVGLALRGASENPAPAVVTEADREAEACPQCGAQMPIRTATWSHPSFVKSRTKRVRCSCRNQACGHQWTQPEGAESAAGGA